jgi:multiple sugar transport system substrate-binding protein
MKKLLLAAVALGCVCAAASFAGSKPEVASTAPVELVVWSTQGQSPQFAKAFGDVSNRLLAKTHPNATVKVVLIEYGSYREKEVAAFAAGTGPDIFDGLAAEWALEGGLYPVAVPLPDDVAEMWTKGIVKSQIITGTFKGKRYGFPVETDQNMLLYYNKDHFAEAGLDPEKPPVTVDEFIAAAKKLTKTDANGNITRSGYAPRHVGAGGGIGQKFEAFIYIFGGQVVSDDLKTTKGYVNAGGSLAAFQFYHDLVYKHKVISMALGSCEDAFQQGTTSMIFREGWFAADTTAKAPKIRYGIASYIQDPRVGNISPNMIANSWAWLVSKDCKNKQIAFDLFKALCNVDADVEIHQSAGYPPALQASLDSPWFKSLPYAAAVKEFQEKIAPKTPQRDLVQWSLMREAMGEQVVACLSGMAPKEAADKAAERMDKILLEGTK